jgi:RES domain
VALDIAVLRQIPVGSASERVFYRTVHLPLNGQPDPLHVLPEVGRWPTAWTLYTATTATVAWAEYCRNHAADVSGSDVTGGVGLSATTLPAFATLEVSKSLPRRALYELHFEFEALADLTSPWAEELLRRSGFDLSSFYTDPAAAYGDCPELAGLTHELGWEAIRVPSAAWQRPDGFCVPVFESGRGRLVATSSLLASASPSVATAVATAYAAGERPGWLGG